MGAASAAPCESLALDHQHPDRNGGFHSHLVRGSWLSCCLVTVLSYLPA